jgi:hypothetical protein
VEPPAWSNTATPEAVPLTDEQRLNLVKAAMDPDNPMNTGGWNRVKANTTLLAHTMKAIARPNNDMLYITAALDRTDEPVRLEAPAFDSKYVSLMVTGYDHYVNIPMRCRRQRASGPPRCTTKPTASSFRTIGRNTVSARMAV